MTYQTKQRPWEPRWESIAPHIPAGGGYALDLGASDGEFARELSELGFVVHAVERGAPPASKPSGVTWHQDILDAHYIATAARRFEIPGGRFDVILAMSILHHLPDWAAAYWAVRGASKLSFIEVPNPLEQRKGRPSKLDHKLPSLDALVKGEVVGTAPGWKSDHLRDIRKVNGGRPPGVPAWVKSGNGIAQRNLPKLNSSVLGYVPVPGTLNVETLYPIKLEEDPDVIDSHRGEYRVWPVRLNGIPAHIYRPPRARSWSHLEIVAPVSLRTVLAVDDGGVVFLELEN